MADEMRDNLIVSAGDSYEVYHVYHRSALDVCCLEFTVINFGTYYVVYGATASQQVLLRTMMCSSAVPFFALFCPMKNI